jgi:hypothetical protein
LEWCARILDHLHRPKNGQPDYYVIPAGLLAIATEEMQPGFNLLAILVRGR